MVSSGRASDVVTEHLLIHSSTSSLVGLSKKFVNNRIGLMYEGVGTLYSMSPQVLQGIYSSPADLWSCGVITYMLLSSHRPFYHKKRKIMIDRIMRVDYNFEKDYWKPISEEAKDFINHLLVLDPKKRMDAGEALKHIWLSKELTLSDQLPDQTTADAVQENLILYKDLSQLKKIALNVCQCRLDVGLVVPSQRFPSQPMPIFATGHRLQVLHQRHYGAPKSF